MYITPFKHKMIGSALLGCTLAALAGGCASDDGTGEAEQELREGDRAAPSVVRTEPGEGEGEPAIVVDRDEGRSTTGSRDQGPAILVDRNEGLDFDGDDSQDGPRIVDVTRSYPSTDQGSGPSVTRTTPPQVTRPESSPDLPPPTAPTSTKPAPGAGRFLDVVANGTGCPAGTWKGALAADGQSFTVSLDGYKASLSPQGAFAIADCQLAIDLGANVSYAVTSFGFEGAAKLSQGVAAVANAEFAFQGDPTTGESVTKQIVGPHDGKFSVQQVVPSEKLRWSECGVARDLNFRTRVRLTSGVSEASGTVSVASLGGAIAGDQAVTGVRFALRSCASGAR